MQVNVVSLNFFAGLFLMTEIPLLVITILHTLDNW